MVSIIRSPVISEEKRKLSSRRSQAVESTQEVVEAAPSIVEPSHPPQPVFLKNVSEQDIKDLVEQARQSVLTQFKEEAESARELGRQRGLREGHLAGVEEAKKNFTSEIDRVRLVADKLQKILDSGGVSMEDMAVAIAFEAVCKVLGNAAVTHDGVQAFVRQAAMQLRGSEKVVVRLHKSDLAILTDAGVLDDTLPSGATVSWVADKSVELGGCVIKTDCGDLDARLETQLDRLRAVLVAARLSGGSTTNASPIRRKTPDRRKSSDKSNSKNVETERRKNSRRAS